MIIRENPFPILRLKNKVYKFLPEKKIPLDINWVSIYPKIKIFNKETNTKKFKIPNIEKTKYFIRMDYYGKSIYDSKEKINDLFKAINYFSKIFKDKENKTISLGDIQLRNVYFNKNKFIILDLGTGAGDKVDLFYNQARFLLNIIDCGFYKEALNIVKNKKNKNQIIKEIRRRVIIVFIKRLKSGSIKSALFRFVSFLSWRIILYFHL